jgi:MFS family permease
MLAGTAAYVCAGLLMLMAPSEGAVTLGRVTQGLGVALVIPAALSAVRLLSINAASRNVGYVSTVATLPLAIGPALGLSLYAYGGPAWMVGSSIAAGAVSLGATLLLRLPSPPPAAADAAGRRLFGQYGFQRQWVMPLIASGLNGIYFGAILAYLPIHMQQVHGPNAGLFFTADAVGVVLFRLPGTLLAERTNATVPMVLGLALTVVGLFALLLPVQIFWLLAAGAGTGIGAGLFANGLLAFLFATSGDRSGTATSLSLASLGVGVFVGGAMSGLIVAPWGFHGVIVCGIIAETVGIPLLLLPRSRRLTPAPDELGLRHRHRHVSLGHLERPNTRQSRRLG